MLGVPVFSAVPLQVALYLTELVERAVLEGHSVSAIESALCSIWCGHRLAGVVSPTIYPWMKGVVEGARRSQAAALKHVSIADYLKLELCICIFSSYSVLACSFYYYFFYLGGGGGMQVFFVLVKSWALECGMFPFLISWRFNWLCIRTISTGTDTFWYLIIGLGNLHVRWG